MTQTVEKIDWDVWRGDYDHMTFDGQVAFYNRVFAEFPEQDRFDTEPLMQLLERARARSVVELGGWTGALAAAVLPYFPLLEWWDNYELSAAANAASVCDDARYSAPRMRRHFWEFPERVRCDVFAASHVIEHLRLKHVLGVFDKLDCRYMYLQSPLCDGPTNWNHYRGSHILEVGWLVLERELAARRLFRIPNMGDYACRCYEKASA